jgi:hypothetical protein
MCSEIPFWARRILGIRFTAYFRVTLVCDTTVMAPVGAETHVRKRLQRSTRRMQTTEQLRNPAIDPTVGGGGGELEAIRSKLFLSLLENFTARPFRAIIDEKLSSRTTGIRR